MRARTLVLLCASLVALPVTRADPIRIIVRDTPTGPPIAARAYLQRASQNVLPDGLKAYRRGLEEHFLLTGDDTIELAPGEYSLEVGRGLEYEPSRTSFRVPAATAIEIILSRWAAMNRDGWYSADMHVHRDPRDLAAILLAEDLNFAPTVTYHVWSEQVSKPFPAASSFPTQVDSTHLFTANSQEVERIQGGPGAVILMGKNLPIPFEGTEYYPPAAHFTRAVHRAGGHVSGDKVFWLDTYVNVALGELDFVELNCNHFLPHEVHTNMIRWSDWPVEMGYRGNDGFALSMMDVYYRLLNCGFALPLVGGSASGVMATPVGYNRVYAYLGDQPLTYDHLLSAMKAGRSFTTNGPLLDLRLNGEIAPGSHRAVKSGEKLSVAGTVRSRKGLRQIDLVVNGKVFRSYPLQGEKEFRLSENLPVGESSWIVLRAFEPEKTTVVFGHTSPAWLTVDRKPVRSAEDAKYFVNKIDELIRYTQTRAVFQKPEQLEETLNLYRDARAAFERRAGAVHGR